MTVLTVLAVGFGCFALEWLAINQRIKEQRKADPLLPYLSAIVETSIPFAALLVTAQYVGPAYALLTPAPFMFPLLIVLSTLRLDFKLSVFTGAVAAIQYWFVSLVYIHKTGVVSIVEPILVSAPPRRAQ